MTTKTKKAPTTATETKTAPDVKVVATAKESREGSFFHVVQKLASKPISLESLIMAVTKEVGKDLRSEKDASVVCRTRITDGLKRLGFLKKA